MIRHIEYQDPYVEEYHYSYHYILYSEFEKSDLRFFPKNKMISKKSKYLNIGCGFDIETSKIPDEHLSFMYIWQMSFDNIVICGRSWDEWLEFMNIISSYYGLGSKKKLIIWIHNLSFEFQFIKKLLSWDVGKNGWAKIFALDSRKIVKAESNGFEFRDSLTLTNLSLKKVASDYHLNHQKLVGDLDYKKIRFSDTELTDQEYAYCFNDVLILSDFFHQWIKPTFFDKKIKISLTSTGILRDEMKRWLQKLNPIIKNQYLNDISRCFPDRESYIIMMCWLFRGGYVHSAPGLTDQVILYSLASYDFKSAYPAAMLQELFPWEFVEALPDEWIKMLDDSVTKTEAYYGYFEISGIKSKGYISYESSNKIVEYVNARWDNGRLWEAEKIRVWLNEYDMKIYHDVYDIKEIKCLSLKKSIKKELPRFLKNLVLKYFVLKEEIGKIDKESIDYKNAKARLNSFYGMICTQLYDMEYHYNPDSGCIDSVPTDKDYNELIENQILLPQWGIWVTSIIRYRLIHYGFTKLKGDAIYGDTDSVKIKNYIENEYIFNDFNNMIRRINKKMYVGNYDRKYFQDLGTFDFEEKMMKFKCLGAKRYLYSYSFFDKKSKKYILRNVSTIAGMKKGTLDDYAKYHEKNIYDCFKDGLLLDLSLSKKMTSIYDDVGFELDLDDHHIKEASCVTLVEIPFKLSLTDEYIRFLDYIKRTDFNRLAKKKYINMFY